MKSESVRLRNRERVRGFASRLKLPQPFADIGIKGLAQVVGCDAVTPRNKEVIFLFLNHISPEVSERRLTFYTHKLRKLAVWLAKDFDVVTEDDVRGLVTFLSKGKARDDSGRYSRGTVHGYKVTLKRFYRWLEGSDEEYPRKVRWIKTSGDTTRIQEPEQLLTFDEVLEMIRHARTPRDKAMISFLYESGARVGEMLSMHNRHLEFTATCVKATLPVSKTQPRIIPLVACTKHLATWINYHPLKDDPDAPLWSNLKGEGRSALIPQTVCDIVKKMALEAGIRKRVYPHLFRACSMTHKHRRGWPEQAIKAFHGLSKDSDVLKHYIHLSYTDLERIQRRMHGLETKEDGELEQGIKCSGCGTENPLYVERCECGLPTEIRRGSAGAGRRSMEAEIATQVEKKVREFVKSQRGDDLLMERFMSILLEKARGSPELRRAISEVSETVSETRARR